MHGVAQVSIDDFTQVGLAPADRSQMERLAAVIDRIIVPQEQAMVYSPLISLRGNAGHARRHDAVPIPEDVNVRMRLACQGA